MEPLPEATVLFAEVSGSTRICEKLGDASARALIDECIALVLDSIKKARGRVVKTFGGEVVAVFPDADAAIDAAIDMQCEIHEIPPVANIRIGIGIGFHHGPVVERDGDVFGDGANVAARLAAVACKGQILTSRVTSDRMSPLLKAMSRRITSIVVKGEELDVCEMRWEVSEDLTTLNATAVLPPPSNLSEIPVPITDDVCFTVTAPRTVSRASQFVLDVWAHLRDHRESVLAQAADEASGRPIRSKTRSAARVERGKCLCVQVDVRDFGFSAADSILWKGTIGNATFALTVPEDSPDGTHIGTATFAVDGVQISRLHFELEVGNSQGLTSERSVRERRPSSAFASYASEDRDRVLARIQGMQKLLPDLNIFLDIASLRSGDDWNRRLEDEIARRDTFYLFWSLAASRSQWVEKEWRAALRLKGIANIDPVPLEPPQKAPPPAELQSLHFNEWTLAFQDR